MMSPDDGLTCDKELFPHCFFQYQRETHRETGSDLAFVDFVAVGLSEDPKETLLYGEMHYSNMKHAHVVPGGQRRSEMP